MENIMAQRFLIVGNKAYRSDNALDATSDPNFRPGPQTIVEFPVTARINEIFAVTRFTRDADTGTTTVAGTMFVRTIEDLVDELKSGELVSLTKLFVFPFLEKKPRSDKGEKAAA
jgi:hypothetical protein